MLSLLMLRSTIVPLIYLLLYLVTQTTEVIFKPTLVFYSQLCTLGHVSPAASTSFTCTTEQLQQNIVRTGIALSEFTKPGYEYFSFNASVSAGGSSTSSFSITIQMAMPLSGMNLGYFLLVIKAQTTAQMIDLIHWDWGRGTNVDTDQNLNRTITQFKDIPSNSIFTTGTGLVTRPLITSLHMTPRLNSDGTFSNQTDTQFNLLVSNSGNSLNITLDVFDETRISFIRGIVLLYNPTTIAAQITANTWNMAYLQQSFSIPLTYSFATAFSAYGPKYNQKCFLGYNKIFVEGYHNINFNFANTSMGNFSVMNFNTDSPTKHYGIVFCFGNDTECGENQVWIDSLNGLCYLPTTCPLPVFALWTQVNLCPICTQLICTNCTLTNRSNCLTCGPNSTLTSGQCVCNAGYWPWMTAISTSALGMWNGVANSQTQCRQNCTVQIVGCAFDKCTSGTFCTQCLTGYVLSPVDATTQPCVTCTSVMPNCSTCTSSTVCLTCQTNFYLKTASTCELCNVPKQACLTCGWVLVSTVNTLQCLTCETGWSVVSGSCVCSPTLNGLLYCQTCTSPTVCTLCVSNLYFLNATDTLCYLCSAFDPNCVQCSSQSVCTLCATLYGVMVNLGGTTTCVLCADAIPNCVECLVSTSCTVCAAGYYVLGDGSCELCSVPMPGCLTCTNGATCTSCDTQWTLTGVACVCNPVTSLLSDCLTCSSPTVCTSCSNNTFYLYASDNLCHPCTTFDAQCVQCSLFENCTLCTVTNGIKLFPNGTNFCASCGVEITNCLQCTFTNACTLCDTNYFITMAQDCLLCSIPIPGCLTCPNALSCTSCDAGWTLNLINICVCDPVASGLANCQTCAQPTICTRCVSNLFYVDPVDFLCYPCTTFDPNCVQCGSLQHCSLCATTFGIQINADGTTTCVPCGSVLNNCTECTMTTACTNCDLGFGLNLARTCSTCDSFFRGCLECQSSTACLKCSADSFLVAGRCRYCWELFQCTSCVYNAPISFGCVSCQTGYFITPDATSGTLYCRPCPDLTSYCATCNSTECLSCQFPYLLAPDKTCSLCAAGYEMNNGFCTNITGCQNVVLNATGQQVCIACVMAMHFVMDTQTNNTCVCAIGYKQVLQPQISLLPRCLPICGDGLVQLQYESCDDNNTQSYDGCSSTCQVQADFDCGVNQPSICLLQLNIGSIKFNHVYRTLGKNEGVMSFSIYPIHEGLTKMKWEKLIKFNFSTTAVNQTRLSFVYQPVTGELLVTVPYTEELEQTYLESFFTLDPNYIISQPPNFLLTHQLKGINAPLIFEHQSQLETQKNINLITLLLTILLLLQFYAGSYSHKMIGLQTIQLIQSIYFVRMVAASSSTSLMNSLNSIQYSAGGYHNEQIFYGDTTDVELSLMGSTADEFLMIDLKRYFLLNANLALFPIIVAVGAFLITLVRKYRARNEFIETKQQQLKDRYTSFRRSSQWVYDHFVFPYIMMFSLISYFQTILLLSSPSKVSSYSNIQTPSFASHIALTFATIAIYCYQLFNSLEAYRHYSMTQSQREQVPKSTVEKLEHDQNNVDRANYHPGYIFCYLVYYFFLSLSMVGTVVLSFFNYALEVNMGLAILYLIAIVYWQPYARVTNLHNHFLKLYYGTFVIFLVFCYIFSKVGPLDSTTYILIMYLIMVLIASVMVSGFVRLYLEYKFRKALEENNNLLGDLKKPKRVIQVKDQNGKQITKKQALVMNNQYAFDYQLEQYEKKLNAPRSIMNSNLMKNLSVHNKKDYLVKKIRQDIHKKKENMIIDTIAHNGFTNEMKRIAEEKQFEEDGLQTAKNNLSDLLLDKKASKQDSQTGKAQKGIREDIKAKLRKQWLLMDHDGEV